MKTLRLHKELAQRDSREGNTSLSTFCCYFHGDNARDEQYPHASGHLNLGKIAFKQEKNYTAVQFIQHGYVASGLSRVIQLKWVKLIHFPNQLKPEVEI